MTPLPLPVSDLLSNYNDQLVTAARIIGRSQHKQKVFEAIYRGQTQIKTIKTIAKLTGLSPVEVLNAGLKMHLLVEKVKGGYKKKKELAPKYRTILSMARNRRNLERLSTKIAPQGRMVAASINVTFPPSAGKAIQITVDEIDSFSRISKVDLSTIIDVSNFLEEKIKQGFQKIIGERGKYKDWGGEKSDLYTSRILLKGKRTPTAIAFKGRGTKGKLVPGKMGVNGEQINRLFNEPADLFLVVYNGQIDSAVIAQMQAFAIAKAIGGQRIYYGVIDETDFARIATAYTNSFK